MRTLIHRAEGPDGTPVLLALLSGSFSEPEDFVREGFPAAVRDHGIDAEIVMAEMRAAWFADGSIVRRIRESVVLPAQRAAARASGSPESRSARSPRSPMPRATKATSRASC